MRDKKVLGDLTFSILSQAENVPAAAVKPLQACLATLQTQDLCRAERVRLTPFVKRLSEE
jgi:hypothetical protein